MSTPKQALEHVASIHPEVTHVMYFDDGRWLYITESGKPVKFTGAEDISLLESASDAAYSDKGYPSAYSL